MNQGFKKGVLVFFIGGMVAFACASLGLYASLRNPIVHDQPFWLIFMGVGVGMTFVGGILLTFKTNLPRLINGDRQTILIEQNEGSSVCQVQISFMDKDGQKLQALGIIDSRGVYNYYSYLDAKDLGNWWRIEAQAATKIKQIRQYQDPPDSALRSYTKIRQTPD